MVRVINVGAEAAKGRGEFKLIPSGTKLKVAVYEVEETVTGPNAKVGPGKAQLVYTAKVTEEGEWKGREIRFNYVPLHGEGNDGWKLVTFADAVGWEADDEGNVQIPDNVTDILGVEFVARIGQSKSNKINEATGEPYINNTVNGTLPLKSYKPKTPEAEKPKVSWDKV
jgi:hypothetical protein